MGAGIFILPFSHLSADDADKRIHPHWAAKASLAKNEAKRIQEEAAGYLAAHLEEVLGRKVIIGIGEKGKPFDKNSGIPVRFNISHTKGLAVLAYSEETEVGVDTERIVKGPETVAKRFFSHAERIYLKEGENDGSASERFFRIWTGKEACMKLTGDGLRLSPEQIEILGLSNSHEPAAQRKLMAGIRDGLSENIREVTLTQNLFQTGDEGSFVITAAWGECLSETVKIDII